MTESRDGNHSENNNHSVIPENDHFGDRMDFDYSSILDKDYSKDLEQKIFVEDTLPDLSAQLDQPVQLEQPVQLDQPVQLEQPEESTGITGLGAEYNKESTGVAGLGAEYRKEGDNLSPYTLADTGKEESETLEETENRPLLPTDVTGPGAEYRNEGDNLSPYTLADTVKEESETLEETGTHFQPSNEKRPQSQSQADLNKEESETLEETENRPLSPNWIRRAVHICVIILLIGIGVNIFFPQDDFSSSHSGSSEQSEGSYDWDSEYRNRMLSGTEYADFYTPKFIATEDYYSSDDYKEICIIDAEPVIGTASEPLSPDPLISDPEMYNGDFQEFYSTDSLNLYTFNIFPDSSAFEYGISASYASPDYNINYSSLESMFLPKISDETDFFTAVKESFETEFPNSYDCEYSNMQIGSIKTADVDGHQLSYMETTYTADGNVDILDVVSFEQRPEGYALIAEYRCPKSEISQGDQALAALYKMLTFRAGDELDTSDAAGGYWSESRIYNRNNLHSALINVSDFMMVSSANFFDKGEVEFSGNDYNGADVIVTCHYNDYESFEGSFDQYIKDEMGYEIDPSYFTKDKVGKKKEFEFDDSRVYYFSYSYNYLDTDTKIFHYLILTPSEDEVVLEVKYEEGSPDDFDPEEFLQTHVTLE